MEFMYIKNGVIHSSHSLDELASVHSLAADGDNIHLMLKRSKGNDFEIMESQMIQYFFELSNNKKPSKKMRDFLDNNN